MTGVWILILSRRSGESYAGIPCLFRLKLPSFDIALPILLSASSNWIPLTFLTLSKPSGMQRSAVNSRLPLHYLDNDRVFG